MLFKNCVEPNNVAVAKHCLIYFKPTGNPVAATTVEKNLEPRMPWLCKRWRWASSKTPGSRFAGIAAVPNVTPQNSPSVSPRKKRRNRSINPSLVKSFPQIFGYASRNGGAPVYGLDFAFINAQPRYGVLKGSLVHNPDIAFETTGSWLVRTIPEPSTMLLLCTGLAGLGFFRRRRKVA